jgi:Mrp family chromosome partitioning ATPase
VAQRRYAANGRKQKIEKERENEKMSECGKESCSGCAHAQTCTSKQDMKVDGNPFSKVKKVIGIVSGKGGVGKSFVTASLARMMRERGYSVGILDADITGPSIPKMYGVHGIVKGSEDGMLPSIAQDGTRIMSVNLLLEDEEMPVIWRGPVIAGVVTQFWTDVMWGDLDYLFVDMPPGTGDVPLTVFQSLPVDGVVIVTSPQDLVRMIVKKAYNMANQMQVPVLGMVENYSYVKCPDCGKELHVFGESKIDEIAAELGVPVLGKMPMDLELAKAVEEERFYEMTNPYLTFQEGQIL